MSETTVSRTFYTVGTMAVRRITSGAMRGQWAITRSADLEILKVFTDRYAAESTAPRFDAYPNIAPKAKVDRMAALAAMPKETLIAVRDLYATKDFTTLDEDRMIDDVNDALAIREG